MRLRAFTEADGAALFGWFPDEASLMQWGGPAWRFPLDAAQLGAMLALSRGARPERRLWAGDGGGATVAHCQAALDWTHGVARLTCVAVAPAARGRGLAEPFLRAVLAEAFAPPEFERVELHVYTFNEAAIRLYRRLGFTDEGVRRAAVRVGAARWDSILFGMLRDERP